MSIFCNHDQLLRYLRNMHCISIKNYENFTEDVNSLASEIKNSLTCAEH